MIQDRDSSKKIAEKIAKCLALAQSANTHEAEAALRQANALMQKYQLTVNDAAASAVTECEFKTSNQRTPAAYILALAQLIADVFACQVIAAKYVADKTGIQFIGMGTTPELAGYTFEVLQRQLTRDRRNYVTTLSRCGRATKTRRGNLFCQAWVDKIKSQVDAFASKAEQAAIDTYMQKNYQNLTTHNSKSTPFKAGDYSAWFAGQVAAKNVSLHRPLQTKFGLHLSDDTNE